MVKVPCYSADGNRLDDIEVDVSVFGEKILPKMMHQMVVGYAAHKRQGTHKVKSRGEVKASNRKMWRQKGTGRARAGRRNNPVWRGGGVIFGPKPRAYDPALPRRMRRRALDSALLSKFIDNEVIVIESFGLGETPKTKTVATLLAKAGVERTALVGTKENDTLLYKSARNIAAIKVREIRNFNAYDVLKNLQLVLTREALDALVESRREGAEKARAKKAAAAAQ